MKDIIIPIFLLLSNSSDYGTTTVAKISRTLSKGGLL